MMIRKDRTISVNRHIGNVYRIVQVGKGVFNIQMMRSTIDIKHRWFSFEVEYQTEWETLVEYDDNRCKVFRRFASAKKAEEYALEKFGTHGFRDYCGKVV